MIWAAWVLIALFTINAIGAVAVMNRPLKAANPTYTNGAGAFLIFITAVSIALLAVIGWNWATFILLADFVVFLFLGLAKVGKPFKPVSKARAIRNVAENIIEIALVIIAATVLQHG